MIRKGKAEFSRMGKCEAFLDSSGPELYNSLPSPRVLNTHNRFDWLPPKVRFLIDMFVNRLPLHKDFHT